MESSNPNPSSSEDLAQLREQVASLTRRVAALERSAGFFAAQTTGSVAQTVPEHRIGLTIVNRVGAITLALGILFFFRYAADNGWIGPVGRLVVGLIAGLCFLAFGERLRQKQQAALALGINGCGLAILYITAYAAGELYKVLLPSASIVLMAGAAALGVTIAIRVASQSLCAVSLAAAFITPWLMNKTLNGATALVYFALVGFAGLAISVKQNWMITAATNLALLSSCAFSTNDKIANISLLFFSQAAAYWTARLRVTKLESMANTLYVSGHAALLLGSLCLVGAWVSTTSIALTLASVFLALYGIALLTLGVAQKSNINRLTGLALLGLVIGKLYLYDIWQLNYGFRITAFVILGALLLAASFIYNRWKTRN